jgi:hypothetical protein
LLKGKSQTAVGKGWHQKNIILDDVKKIVTIIDVAKQTELERAVFAMGSNFGNVDNDGWLDMYLGTGNPDFKSLIPNRMFKRDMPDMK